ncbi:type IV secretion system protein [Bartonella raoultii]|uniref:Type IV secretion system protein n=1 Tax=Bartonella raoultii TaxID=1457020 RepID=A0ABS7I8D7_9HYPH|nr:type IV secretion system protein [Bartonella raoultii]MBX4335906.1 type IV secretion system protein [Bartonella raoultii]MBX4335907.1 type IV secretion system protein [Bartonella raoultii]MBX4335910.1 type IV secretion system protein [Bartonella raoultii]MBX4335912.1 type IV secretion system protein [Bartonella raoultii]
MAFQLFTELFNIIETATQTYITDISKTVITVATPFISTGLTIAFIVYAILVMRGTIEMPVSEFLSRCLRMSIVISIAITSGLYQQEITDIIIKTPSELFQALIKDPADNTKLSDLLDQAAKNGFSYANQNFEEAVYFNSDGFLFALFGILMLLATCSFLAIGSAFILLAKVIISLLAGLGPFFILALLWQATRRFFDQWIVQILSYTILIVFLSTLFNLMMRIFLLYTQSMQIDYSYNMGYTLGGAIILSIIFTILLFKLSGMAHSLAKGITLGHLWRGSYKN